MPMQELTPGNWQFRVSLRRDPTTGRYGRAVRHFAGPTQTGKKPPQAVQDAYAAFLVEARAGEVTKRRKATLNDAFAQFMQVAELKPLTRQTYLGYWKRDVESGLGRTAMADLTAMDCTRLYAALGGKGRAVSSIRQVHALIRNACKTAVNELGWIKVNPAVNARLPRRTTVEPEPPDAEAVEKLIALSRDDPDFEVFLELAIGMGGRRGEVLALRRSCIEETETGSILHVREAVYVLNGDRRVHLGPTKSHQQRQVHLSRDLTLMLRAHLARQQMRANTVRVARDPDPFLFSRDPAGAEPWRPDFASQRFSALWGRTGAAHARLHDLRHFHATELVDAGVAITVIQKRLGHSNVATTSIYAHRRDEADVAAAEAFESRRRRNA